MSTFRFQSSGVDGWVPPLPGHRSTPKASPIRASSLVNLAKRRGEPWRHGRKTKAAIGRFPHLNEVEGPPSGTTLPVCRGWRQLSPISHYAQLGHPFWMPIAAGELGNLLTEWLLSGSPAGQSYGRNGAQTVGRHAPWKIGRTLLPNSTEGVRCSRFKLEGLYFWPPAP